MPPTRRLVPLKEVSLKASLFVGIPYNLVEEPLSRAHLQVKGFAELVGCSFLGSLFICSLGVLAFHEQIITLTTESMLEERQ